MRQANPTKRLVGHIVFGNVGGCAILLFLLWNPLVLRPRFWNAWVIVRSFSIDAALLLIGVGLIHLRRWAALSAAALAASVVIEFAATGGVLAHR
jgi:hypothetical protein